MNVPNTSTATPNLIVMLMTIFLALISPFAIYFVGYALIDWLHVITPPANAIQGYGANLFRGVVGVCAVMVPVFLWVLMKCAFPHWFTRN